MPTETSSILEDWIPEPKFAEALRERFGSAARQPWRAGDGLRKSRPVLNGGTSAVSQRGVRKRTASNPVPAGRDVSPNLNIRTQPKRSCAAVFTARAALLLTAGIAGELTEVLLEAHRRRPVQLWSPHAKYWQPNTFLLNYLCGAVGAHEQITDAWKKIEAIEQAEEIASIARAAKDPNRVAYSQRIARKPKNISQVQKMSPPGTETEPTCRGTETVLLSILGVGATSPPSLLRMSSPTRSLMAMTGPRLA
jgi:hypothetical protein